jgi:hypothetical protein
MWRRPAEDNSPTPSDFKPYSQLEAYKGLGKPRTPYSFNNHPESEGHTPRRVYTRKFAAPMNSIRGPRKNPRKLLLCTYKVYIAKQIKQISPGLTLHEANSLVIIL